MGGNPAKLIRHRRRERDCDGRRPCTATIFAASMQRLLAFGVIMRDIFLGFGHVVGKVQ
jgi:hypothetical protein